MSQKPTIHIGKTSELTLISGPCAIESESLIMSVAEHICNITQDLPINYIFKSSFDKANRSALNSSRGVGMESGLKILDKVRNTFNIPVLTDVHEDTPVDEVADVVDILQTPAFLCRQTNFILKVAASMKPINIKKGQFLSPHEMINVVNKAKSTGNNEIFVCERGVSFGYNNLVSDMRSLIILRETKCPVIYDASHSVQQPGGQGEKSGGQREFVEYLSRAAAAVGVAAIFLETHQDPDNAPSDGPNMVPLNKLDGLINQIVEIDNLIKK